MIKQRKRGETKNLSIKKPHSHNKQEFCKDNKVKKLTSNITGKKKLQNGVKIYPN